MRKNYLRVQVDNYCRQNHSSSLRDKKYRHFVLHKMIRDLFQLGCLPPKWHAVKREQIQNLVIHWRKEKIHPSTIMKYMKVIRDFFQKIEHLIPDISNQQLGLKNPKRHLKRALFLENDLDNPIAKLLLDLQIHFGLTLGEAMRLCPSIHVHENAVLLTREMTTNSLDRMLPIRNHKQLEVLDSLKLLSKESSLITTYGYHPLRHLFSHELKAQNLLSSFGYRYLYAKSMYKELSKILSPYLVKQTLMREMGLQSRRTLWSYLNE